MKNPSTGRTPAPLAPPLLLFSFTMWALLLPTLSSPLTAGAQDLPDQRQIRTYIPPEQLVSFLPTTPFDRFVEYLNPIFQNVVGKQVIDPTSRTEPIGISITGMHFMDALALVLQYKGLTYRETDRFFIIEQAPAETEEAPTPVAAASGGALPEVLATLDSREIQINAVLFELNQTRARQLGIDWNVLFGEQSGSGSGSGSGTQRADFALRTGEMLGRWREYYIDPPERIMFSQLTQLFRLLEQEGIGETIAQPSVAVQSGEQGRIQIGSDIPVQVRDFAGNTITQFVSTGIIVDVTPTLISETVDEDEPDDVIDFIHMNVQVERSNGRPFGGSVAVDRSTANTRVLLLDGEQTVIGGLYSTDLTTTRRGVPLLKDLPGWFFGLRYVFGYEQRAMTQRELLIVLHAQVRDPLTLRADRPFDTELLEQRRQDVRENLLRFDEQSGRIIRYNDTRIRPRNNQP